MLRDSKHFNDRLYWLDYAKGIGIILVVVGHVISGLVNSSIILFSGTYFYLFKIIYAFHMPLFFFLSGFLFLSSFRKDSSVCFLIKKVDSILYPFCIWMFIQGVVQIVFADFVNHSIQIIDIFYFWVPRDQFWFLAVLFMCFLTTYTIYTLSSARAVYISFLLGGILLFMSNEMDHGLMRSFSQNYFFFTLGLVASKQKGCWYSKSSGFVFFYGILCLACFGFAFLIFRGSFSSVFTAVLGITIVVLLSVLENRPVSRYLNYIGKHSLEIFVMHILFTSGVRELIYYFGVETPIYHFIIGVFVGLVAPLIFIKRILKNNRALFQGKLFSLCCMRRG